MDMSQQGVAARRAPQRYHRDTDYRPEGLKVN